MDNREELLSEEVRKYEHLYNPSMSEYKDTEMASNSWKEISANVGLPSGCCHVLTPGTPHPDPGLSGFPSPWTEGPCADMKPSSGASSGLLPPAANILTVLRSG
ncbi:unnamed protein product [Pleuronectes platessa]|uniref:MADF domain-containing protein n=1 Tax=Pleuronectes platessa TaxID=8262 RepID=A0A9N7TRT4_PLEPL|nr:unnamed protein product [Pleuronectes platessa]